MTSCEKGGSKEVPVIRVAYPNENKSHLKATPLTGTPGVDPCGSSCSDQDTALCEPTACTAGAPDTTAPGSCYDAQSIHQRQCECDKCLCERMNAVESDRPCYQHVEGNRYQSIYKRHPDPEIQAIRDRMRNTQEMRDLFTWCPTDESLSCVVRKFRQYPVGLRGQASVHYGAAQDADYPKQIIHGLLSDNVTPGTKLISPSPRKWVDQLELDIKESIYESRKLRPVGKSHDQTLRLPPNIHPHTTGFGKATDKSISAAILINPPKTREEIAQESKCCRALYKATHGAYEPGEQVSRNYEGSFSRNKTFGKPTPCDVAGRLTKKVSGSWRTCEPDPPFVSKVYADHLDFRYPKLGMGQEGNCIRKEKGEHFTYGRKSDTESERPINEIIFNRCPSPGADKANKIMQNLKNWLDKIRRNFKMIEGPDFELFYEQILIQDPACEGLIPWDALLQAMDESRVGRTMGEKEFMEALALVGVFQGERVDYYALMDLIKGYKDPAFHCNTTTLQPYYCPHTTQPHFQSTYAEMGADLGAPSSKEMRAHGMPSIRKDRVPRKIRSTKDFTNYGDDGDAYSLIWPSFYTRNGINCRDAFREMTKEEITKVMCLAEVSTDHEEIEAAWVAAQALDPEGLDRVSYQTFREGICQVREENAKRQNLQITYPPESCQPCDQRDGVLRIKGKPNPCCGVDP